MENKPKVKRNLGSIHRLYKAGIITKAKARAMLVKIKMLDKA